jgi:hypothetical protein
VAYDVRSVSTATGTGTGVTLASPAGAAATDGIYVMLVQDAGVQASAPTGWTLLSSVFAARHTLRLYQGTVAATSGPWTFTLLTSGPYAAAAIAVQADGAAPGATIPVPDVAATLVAAATTGSATPPAATPTNTGDVVLFMVTWDGGTTFTPPGGTTERVDSRSGDTASDKTLWVGSRTAATTAGVAITPPVVTNDNPNGLGADEYAMLTLALKSVPPPTTWVGDFETGDTSQYAWFQAADSSRIELRTDTPRQGTYYARFTALDDDVYPLTPTDNPRAQLVSPRLLFAGTERWIQWATRFPASFPNIDPAGFFVTFQIHGPPYTGSPQVGFGVSGSFVNLERNVSYGFDTVWETEMPRDTWMNFVLHVNFAQDATGYIELWLDGKQQTFRTGVRRLQMKTIETDQVVGVEIDPTLYRSRGLFPTATLDHDVVRFDATVPASLTAGVQIAPPVKAFGPGPATSATARAKVVG